MTPEAAKSIILHAVSATQSRWSKYDQSWSDINQIFISHGYEQGGFQIFKMIPLMEDRGIYSINSLGSILYYYTGPKKYDRNYAGSLDSKFYNALRSREFGQTGLLLYSCIDDFLTAKIGSPGAFFWRIIWQLLVCCNFLSREYNSSFSEYIRSLYGEFAKHEHVSDNDFLKISSEEWQNFLEKVKPWKNLYGIGQNVFDFIFGDIVEAKFVSDSFKFDSANQHFLMVTGICDLVKPFTREATIEFLKQLHLPYTLRQINKGIYTYCSKTEAMNFGFCRSINKCLACSVNADCHKRF